MITLSGIRVGHGMRWEEEGQYTGVSQTLRQTTGGRPILYTRAKPQAMPITLVSSGDMGIVKHETYLELQRLSQDPTGQYVLTIKDKSYSVYFRHYDPPVLTWSPIIPRTKPQPDDFGRLTLKLVSYGN